MRSSPTCASAARLRGAIDREQLVHGVYKLRRRRDLLPAAAFDVVGLQQGRRKLAPLRRRGLRLLAEAGYPDGFDIILTTAPPRLTSRLPLIQEQLKANA